LQKNIPTLNRKALEQDGLMNLKGVIPVGDCGCSKHATVSQDEFQIMLNGTPLYRSTEAKKMQQKRKIKPNEHQKKKTLDNLLIYMIFL
jgi:hypothetical protein